MSQYNMQTALELTKRLYPQGLDSLLYKKSPFYGLVKKWTEFGGEGKFLAWQIGTGAGAASNFGVAQANKSGPTLKRPFITRAHDYSLASIDNETRFATMGNKYALAEAHKVAMDDARYNITRSAQIGLVGNGGGARGQLDGTDAITDTTATLSDRTKVNRFEPGMWLQAASTDGTSGTVRAGRVQIAGINRETGVITATGSWNAGIPTIVNTDYLFREGDFGAVIKGLESWIPPTAPTAGDNFFGVDRSTDPVRMAGVRYAPTSGNYEEVLIDGAAELLQQGGGETDTVLVNPLDWGSLVKQVGSKRVIDVATSKPGIGFRALELESANGTMKIFPEPLIARRRFFMLEIDCWEIWSLGDMPRILHDGSDGLLEANADAREIRVGYYGNVVCTMPSHNLVGTFPAAA